MGILHYMSETIALKSGGQTRDVITPRILCTVTVTKNLKTTQYNHLAMFTSYTYVTAAATTTKNNHDIIILIIRRIICFSLLYPNT